MTAFVGLNRIEKFVQVDLCLHPDLRVERKWRILMGKKKIMRNILIVLAGIAALCIYYYITIPAINIHSTGTWGAMLLLIVVLLLASVFKQLKGGRQTNVEGVPVFRFSLKESSLLTKILVIVLAALCIVYVAGSILSSPFFNAAKYQKLLTASEREFTDDIREADYKTIPLLDKDSASLFGKQENGQYGGHGFPI